MRRNIYVSIESVERDSLWTHCPVCVCVCVCVGVRIDSVESDTLRTQCHVSAYSRTRETHALKEAGHALKEAVGDLGKRPGSTERIKVVRT